MNQSSTKTYSLETIIQRLNEMASQDPVALTNLINTRIPCNPELAKHPTCQVGATENGFEVGLLGILNGILGSREDGYGLLAAIMEEDGHSLSFVENKYDYSK